GRTDKKRGGPGFGHLANEVLHRCCKPSETDRILEQLASISRGERLIVGEEIAWLRESRFGFAVVTGMDSVIWSLEQARLAISDELKRDWSLFLRLHRQCIGRHNHRCGNIVLLLKLDGGLKIFAQSECAPGSVLVISDAQKSGH